MFKSSVLYHGPRAQSKATQEAMLWGNLIGCYGHPINGLNVDTIREAMSMLQFIPPGDKPSSIVIGPLDILSVDGIEDILLKTLEEPREGVAHIFLWAYDLGGVRPTIRSRCLDSWAPGVNPPGKLTPQVEELIQATHQKSILGILDALGTNDAWKSKGAEFLRTIPEVLSIKTQDILLWERLRPVMHEDTPMHEILGILLP